MPGCRTEFDQRRQIVSCQILATFDDADLPTLTFDLRSAIAAARDAGAVRLLWDNRAGRVLSSQATDAIQAIITNGASPDDRVAVLVADSMAKVRSRPSMTATSALFASENAAVTWLNAGRAVAA
jgi:hypothetical protein